MPPPPVNHQVRRHPHDTRPRRPTTRRHPPPRRPPPPGRKPITLASPQRRIRLALTLLMFGLVFVGGRLVQLQGVDRSSYAAMAERQRLRTVTLTAPRGAITDRTGAPLAVTVDARDIYADPHEVVDPQGAATQIAPLLGLAPTRLAARLGDTNTSFVYVARRVSPQLAAQVMALNIAGVDVLPTTAREYPDGSLAANLLGFVGVDGTGLAGLEYSFNSILSGHDGHDTYEIGRDGRPIPGGQHLDVPAQPGHTLRLTILRDLQWEAQQAIAAQVTASGATSGTVVVMNPRTGEVLALASAPTFDPNNPGASPPDATGNPAVSDAYEPGSVNKVITFSAALQQGVITPLTHIVVPPTYNYAHHVFHDAEVHGTEHLTATGVLAQSSNIGTIQIAQRLGAPMLDKYLLAFGFGAKTGIGLPGETRGLLPPLSQWSDTTLPTVAFGQGVSVTAMQVASVYSTIANGGVRVPPRLVAGTVDAGGHFTPAAQGAPRRVVSAQTAKTVRDMLEAVTSNEGTAPAARIAGYRVAGKTGTASRPNGHGGYSGYTASFVGFAPADNPQLVVEVVVQNPTKGGYYGGVIAAPVFHDVMTFALEELHIPPTGTPAPVAQLTW